MFCTTGYITLAYVAPVGFPDTTVPGGIREEEQLNVTLRALGDEKEYQFNLAINEKTVGLQQLESWQAEGKVVTAFASAVRAVSFVHDTRKDEQGNPLKKYQRAGRKVQVADGLTVETDAFVIFAAYDVRLAGQADLAQEGERAHTEFRRRQAEFKKRSVQARIEKAKERLAQQKAAAQEKLAKAQQAEQAAGGGGEARTRKGAA